MKFEFNKLGPIHQGELELADLTVLCGKNNTGKTYITNSIYSFLANWENLMGWDFPEDSLKELSEKGVVRVDLQKVIIDKLEAICNEAMRRLSINLPDFLATSSERFDQTKFSLSAKVSNSWIDHSFEEQERSNTGKIFLSIKKPTGQSIAEIAFTESEGALPVFVVEDLIKSMLVKAVLGLTFPDVFIASAERTGASIFRSELNFNKNQLVGLLAEMSETKKKINPYEFFRRFKRNYALSVEHNVEFISEIPDLEQRGQTDFIKSNIHLATKFQEIAGGMYKTTKEGGIYFHPTTAKGVRLALGESSSAVRSLMIVWYWLNYVAKPNSLLMIDEPELNLHPENQRKFARFIAALVNAGIKVFVTTHSDYFIRELNTLVMMSSNKPHIAEVISKFGYSVQDCILPTKLAVYNVTEKPFEVEGLKNKKRLGTLERWSVEENHGIRIKSFDEEIREMNNIQDALLYGV